MAKPTLSLAFSRASAAFAGAVKEELSRAGLDGVVDPGMGPILFRLDERDGRTLSELAASSHVARSTMTGIAARMEDRGLVRTAANPLDKRSMVVGLTPKGRAAVAKLRGVEERLNEAFHATAPPRTREGLVEWLEKLAGTLHASYN